MEFRPCIDIHNGRVKQIVGASLTDANNYASENYVSDRDSAWYAKLFKMDNIKGAHVVMLNGKDSEYYESTKSEAFKALAAYPGGLQIGGGITAENAKEYIEAGASHVIITSYAFEAGEVRFDRLKALKDAVGSEHVVLDLSARNRDGAFYVTTDRWQKFTNFRITPAVFEHLSEFCDEFLVHGVDVEGKRQGIDRKLIKILADASLETKKIITYAGGIGSYDDIHMIEEFSAGRLNFTIGSGLDLYGGNISYTDMVNRYK